MSTFDFMKQFSMFATLAAASGGSAPSRLVCRALLPMHHTPPTLATALLDIAQDIQYLKAKEIYIRENWYPFITRIRELGRRAPDDYTRSQLTRAVFIIRDLQGQRGPKHKEKVRQKLLEHLRHLHASLANTSTT
jgi:hypothetical protein